MSAGGAQGDAGLLGAVAGNGDRVAWPAGALRRGPAGLAKWDGGGGGDAVQDYDADPLPAGPRRDHPGRNAPAHCIPCGPSPRA